MTDLDRNSLEHLLPATPGPADWDDVLSRSGAHQRRRRRLVAVAATALVVAVASGSAIGSVRDFVLRTGFIGLPPIGATPSSPTSGELEIWYWAWWAADGEPFFWLTNRNVKWGRTRAWVYADGRLISWGGPDRPGSANPLSTGFLEQRLTPEGVERLRSEIAAAGDFGSPDELAPPSRKGYCPGGVSPSEGNCLPQPATDAPITVPFFTPIVVAGLGPLVHVDHARDLARLYARLSDPGSWLPASAWVDRDIRAYVASKYRVCYSGSPPDEPVEQSRIVSLFPASTRDLLGSATERLGPLFGSPGHFRPSHEYCLDATTDEARALVAALDAAGLERKGGSRLNYDILDGGPDPKGSLYFEPYLPHGEITCSVCG